VEDGELTELKKQKKVGREYTTGEKQRFLAGLNAYAREKGRRQHEKGFYGWAIYRYADKFGCRPSNKMDWSMRGEITDEVRKFCVHVAIREAKKRNSTVR
jgi:hypothetical protein